MLLVDSSVWIDYFNGRGTRQTDFLDRCLGVEPVLTGDIVVTEVLQGFRSDTDFRRCSELLGTLFYEDMWGKEVALLSAKNYRTLRRKGVTVRKTIDVVIASFCIRDEHRLLHNDRDFRGLAEHLGLKVVVL